MIYVAMYVHVTEIIFKLQELRKRMTFREDLV